MCQRRGGAGHSARPSSPSPGLLLGYEPGRRYYLDILREEMPGFALSRAGRHVEAIAQLRREIEHMRKLVGSAADVLEKSGQERRGWRLRRALVGKQACSPGQG